MYQYLKVLEFATFDKLAKNVSQEYDICLKSTFLLEK